MPSSKPHDPDLGRPRNPGQLNPEYLPLTVGVGFGLHGVVFGWILGHPLGLLHAGLRTLLVTVACWWPKTHRISAVAGAVVVAYLYALLALVARSRGHQSATARR